MYQSCIGTVVIAAIALAGCQTSPFDDTAWPELRPLGERLDAYRPSVTSSGLDVDTTTIESPDPSGELTLRQAMALAVVRSPKLRSFGWDVRQAEARVLQAGLWPNPEIEAEFEDFGGTGEFSGTRFMQTTISVAQTFPLGGDIERRKELAGYDSRLAGWDYEAARLEVLTEVTQRFVAVLTAQRRIKVATEALIHAEQVQQTTRKQIEAGDTPQIELARASVPVATARVDLRRSERALGATKKQLAMTWGSNTATFTAAIGELDQLQPPPSSDRLVALINQNPEVARWATEISARQAEARLAQAEAIPDLTGRLGYRRFNDSGDSALVVGISLPLPIFDRRQGDVLAARLGAVSAGQRRREAEMRLESMLSDAYLRLADAYDEAITIRKEALPPATEAFEVTRHAFERGDLAFMDVLDAERTLVELQFRYLDALASYHIAVTEIEGLIGQSLKTISEDTALPSNTFIQPVVQDSNP